MIIKLVRHGRSMGNEDGKNYITTPDHLIKLSEEGKEQAKQLVRDPNMFKPNSNADVYSSPFLRAVSTASIYYDELGISPDITFDHRLREQNWGRPTSDEHHDQLLSLHFNNPYAGKTAISENGSMVFDRVHSFMDSILNRRNDCLIFTHGVTINVFKCIIEGKTIPEFETMGYVRNCSVTTFAL